MNKLLCLPDLMKGLQKNFRGTIRLHYKLKKRHQEKPGCTWLCHDDYANKDRLAINAISNRVFRNGMYIHLGFFVNNPGALLPHSRNQLQGSLQ
jgi:hypothetical protein